MDVPDLLPLFVNLRDRRVVLVGGGLVACAKLRQLLAVGADVQVVAPEVVAGIRQSGAAIVLRPFAPADLDGAWLAVAAAPPAVNRAVREAADARRIFLNAVDDPANATAYFGGVVRRGGVTVAISTSGEAPALTALLREGLDHLLPRDLADWMDEAKRQRGSWKRERVSIDTRRPLLLDALNRLRRPTAVVPAAHAPTEPPVSVEPEKPWG